VRNVRPNAWIQIYKCLFITVVDNVSQIAQIECPMWNTLMFVTTNARYLYYKKKYPPRIFIVTNNFSNHPVIVHCTRLLIGKVIYRIIYFGIYNQIVLTGHTHLLLIKKETFSIPLVEKNTVPWPQCLRVINKKKHFW